ARGINVINSIQTNGTLVDERWCRFFSANQFHVGLSVDGPSFIHDQQRVNRVGLGSHHQAMRGFRLLKEHGIVPGSIFVFKRTILNYPDHLFGFFLENGFRQISFNLEEVENSNTRSSLSTFDELGRVQIAEEYREFLSRFYDLWLPHSQSIRVREF